MTDWQSIVQEHRHLVWQTAYRIVGHEADAADCFQEAFLSALEVARREPVRNWAALLRRLATMRALDRLRQRRRQAAHFETLPDGMTPPGTDPEPIQYALAEELSDRLRTALAQLPSQQAEVFCLRFLEEMSYRQIAQHLSLQTSVIGVLLHRARSRLRELLDPATAAKEN
ncbi:MAG: sigma-70 family RNA polymerase sigma factor [Sedimentisphaerales bacterium]|nr:sigma-70 family RNA polymerase sigma factor [Sedimentisphaerales bacterium]